MPYQRDRTIASSNTRNPILHYDDLRTSELQEDSDREAAYRIQLRQDVAAVIERGDLVELLATIIEGNPDRVRTYLFANGDTSKQTVTPT